MNDNENTRQLYIIGGGGHARVVAAAARLNFYAPIFIVKDYTGETGTCSEEVFLDFTSKQLEKLDMICGIGTIKSGSSREEIIEKYRQHCSPNFVNIVHPHAFVSSTAKLGQGVFIAPGVVVSEQVAIGNHAILNTGCVIDHDCHLHDFVHVATGAIISGGVTLFKSVHVGTGAKIIQNVAIAANVTIGAGTVMIRNALVPECTYVGIPGQILDRLK